MSETNELGETSDEAPATSGPSTGPLPQYPLPELAQALRSENAKLRSALKASQASQKQAEDRLRRLENSPTWQLGSMMVQTARNPKSIGRSSKRIVGMWRKRRQRTKTAPAVVITESASAVSISRSISADVNASLMWARRDAGVVHGGLRIVAVCPSDIVDALAPYADVWRCAPHNAVDLLDSVNPHLVLIHTGVSADTGVWAAIGTAYGADRDARLKDFVDGAAARAIPSVLAWHDAPEELPGLGWLQPLVNAVLLKRGDIGPLGLSDEQLSRIDNPTDAFVENSVCSVLTDLCVELDLAADDSLIRSVAVVPPAGWVMTGEGLVAWTEAIAAQRISVDELVVDTTQIPVSSADLEAALDGTRVVLVPREFSVDERAGATASRWAVTTVSPEPSKLDVAAEVALAVAGKGGALDVASRRFAGKVSV